MLEFSTTEMRPPTTYIHTCPPNPHGYIMLAFSCSCAPAVQLSSALATWSCAATVQLSGALATWSCAATVLLLATWSCRNYSIYQTSQLH
mmetsp:Transcript_20416/g.24512  ORF Transcript_20416/g.24512 Transcript_20416/m.24512 type:complete len:90 (-) Transcript_20416:917-1186(-)